VDHLKFHVNFSQNETILPHGTTTIDNKDKLKMLIEQENKSSPLSDEELAYALKSQGIVCARRTITKYRKSLGLPSVYQRKIY
jgi:RNA polymerase sigma-54 factor